MIVIACNTASAAALHGLRPACPRTVPFVGMEPAVKPAVEHTPHRSRGRHRHCGDLPGRVVRQPARPLRGVRGHVHTQICPGRWCRWWRPASWTSIARPGRGAGILTPLLAAEIDQLVLGCTHYPFPASVIEEIAGAGVAVIDPAPAVARQAGRVLAQQGWLGVAEPMSTPDQTSSASRTAVPRIDSTPPATRSGFKPRCATCSA